MSFNLKTYLDLFPEQFRKRFRGRKYDHSVFGHLERQFSHLRDGKSILQAACIFQLFERERTPFGDFWPAPNQAQLRKSLAKERLSMEFVPGGEPELVRRLLGVFHDIGVVSLILRFTYPEHFGIFSAPIANLLLVHRPSIVGLYLEYCHELRPWQQHFDMGSIAETEMALWAYHELTKGPGETEESRCARQEFEEDLWAQQRRVHQVFRPLEGYDRLELAGILAEQDATLAGMIAGREYERLLKNAGRSQGKPVEGERWAEDLMDWLYEDRTGPRLKVPTRRDLGEGVWKPRNDAVHADRELHPGEVVRMIGVIRCLSRELDQLAARAERAR